MSIINLSDAKVSYEGQTLPAINLISKLQVQLQEMASRMSAMAATLGQLQTCLLNSHTVEVKLTLSKEDYDKFRTLGGVDDSDRIRNALMNFIHGDEREFTAVPVEQPTAVAEPVVSVISPSPEPSIEKKIVPEPLPVSESPAKKKPTTKCPRCQAPIDLTEFSAEQWPVEVKCGNCGAKCLIKSKTDRPPQSGNLLQSGKPAFEPLDEAAYGKLFDMLST